MIALGVDLGTKRIGIAVASDRVATPLEVMERGTDDSDADKIAALALERGASVIVVGNPIRLSGESGPAAEAAARFADTLRARGCEVVLWDERLTTRSAERTLIDAGVRRAKRRQVIDKLAATTILQAWLDANTSYS